MFLDETYSRDVSCFCHIYFLGWFVVPLGVKAITYLHAVGLGCVVTTFSLFVTTIGTVRSRKSEDCGEYLAYLIFEALTAPAMLLAAGWFMHIMMSL